MRIIKLRGAEGTAVLKVETLEDMWSIQRIAFPGDVISSKSLRKFKSNEGDEGEMKEVRITIRLEKTELDKSAERLRFSGKIVDGHPLQYIKINSYHTLNIAIGDVVEVTKSAWHGYVLDVIKNAAAMSKRPRVGIMAVDDEKALPAYLLGYGIAFKNEIYSNLSKRMSQKDFTEQQRKYYDSVLKFIGGMDVDTIIVAGPGFAKDDIKKYGEDSGMLKKMGKRLVYIGISNVERSGVYELIRSEEFGRILQGERIRQEFIMMEEFLKGLSTQKSKYGVENVGKALDEYGADRILVNDSVLGDAKVQTLLDSAERRGVRIEVINADDEVGQQLHAFKDIAAF